MADSPAHTQSGNGLWLRSSSWDLFWISGSVLLMAVPYGSYYVGQLLGFQPDVARNIVNGLVAFLIGGPHMYATHTRTTLDPEFRHRHPSIIAMGFIIPALVIYFGVHHFILLLTVFFFWASLHVLHQIIYIVDCYNGRDVRGQSKRSRIIDYGVVLTALYPIAMYRFVHGTFHVGPNYLFFPTFLKFDAVWWLASALFATALALFVSKTYAEFQRGEGNIPKTVLISITAVATFITPFFQELDVAFQGLNIWHSFQYLGLTWYLNRLRYERGELTPQLSTLSRPGAWWKYYGFNLLLNSTALSVIAILLLTKEQLGLSFDQCYYIVVLCFLLTHYYHDHIIFAESARSAVLSPSFAAG